MDMLAATLWAFDVPLFVLVKREDDFKGFLAVFAIELVVRHRDLRKTLEEMNR